MIDVQTKEKNARDNENISIAAIHLMRRWEVIESLVSTRDALCDAHDQSTKCLQIDIYSW